MDQVDVNVKIIGIEEAIEKATKLAKAIEEARTLAGELASMLEELEITI